MAGIKIIGKLNPKQYSEMLNHLTRKKIKNPFIKAEDIVVNKRPEVEQREMFNRFNQANPRQDMAGGGMLVKPSANESRPGYADQKPLTKREQNIFNNYLKTRKEVGLSVPSDDLKMKIKSKVRVGTIDNQTIKNLKEIYRYENENQSLRYDTKLKRWEKTAGRDKTNYIQKKGETKSEFLRRVANIASRSQELSRKKQDKATLKTRSYIDNWTKNWLDNNLKKYGVRDFDKMTTNLKNDWQKNIKNLKVDKGFLQNLSTKSGLPNVTNTGKNAFNYNGTPFYTSAEVTKAPLSQWRGLFFKDKIQNTPGFKNKILDYFNFINLDKRGLYMQEGGQTIKAYKQIADKDVIYLLSPDANLLSSAKYNLFNSIDNEFSNAYNTYTNKVNKSKQWKESAAKIEKTLGLKSNYIQNSMKKEKAALAKIFDVKQLPEELRYTLEHAQGLSAAARTDDKVIMQRAVDDLIGTTIKQNQALGFGGFEQTRNALVRDIQSGLNVKDNLNSLNKLTADVYKDFGIKDKVYSLENGQLTTKNISPATTREERFAQYFKGLDKTKEGSEAIKKQYGTLENLLAVLGGGDCGRIRKYQGGRVGLKDGTPNVDVCVRNATQRINSGFKNATPADARNYTKLLNAVKGSAVIGKNLLKFGIVPEALYVGADSLVRMGFGDTFKEAGLRASDFFIPGDQMQEADKLKVQRTLGDAAATNVGRVFDYRNQIANIDSLEKQKANLKNLSDVGEFDYIGDLSQDVKNIDTRLNQAKNDLQNKFMVSEAETVAADRALEEAYDISKAKSPLARLKSFAQNIEAVQDDPFLSDIATPQKTQEELNLNMFPTMPRDFLTEKTSDLLDRTQYLKSRGFDVSTKDLIAEQERLRSIPLSQDVITYGPEQMYGAQGTFFGQPLAGGGIAKLAGDRSGPPPERGPMSQGLQGLMKRVRNL